MAVVICLNRFLAPVDDTVTAQLKTQVTSHRAEFGMSSQHINTEALRFKSPAFYNGLKSKVGLAAAKAAAAAAKAAALRVNLNHGPRLYHT